MVFDFFYQVMVIEDQDVLIKMKHEDHLIQSLRGYAWILIFVDTIVFMLISFQLSNDGD